MATTCAPKRILIVEDDLICARLYRTRLEKEGYAVEVAEEGQKGFFSIIESKPDGVLLDLMLPQINGLEILRKTRAQVAFQHTPIVVFSNAYMNGMLADAFAAGATRVLNKSDAAVMQNVVAAFADAFNPTLPSSVAPGFPRSARKPAPPENNPVLIPSIATGQTNIYLRDDTSFISSSRDHEMLAEAASIFFDSAPETMAGIRRCLRGYSREPETKSGAANLNALYRKIHSVTGSSGFAGLETFSNFCACLEAYLRELHANAGAFQSSTLRTLALAIDLLGELFTLGPDFACALPPDPVALVVDDDPISRRAVEFGLNKSRLKSTCVGSSRDALAEIAQHPYELIFLDVDMPEINGFDLVPLIRQTPLYDSTPIVFVTGLRDFQTRARSTACHASDFISKPLSFLELAVKALTLLIKGRIQHPAAPPPLFVT